MELCVLEGSTLSVMLPEEIDHHTAGGLARRIDDAMLRNCPSELIFDFGKVRFMDSSGIGLLIGRYRNMQCIGGQVYMRGASQHMSKIIAMSGVEKYIRKYEEAR